jgi:MFS family permease
MALSGIVASLGAVIAAAVLLTRWLRMPGHTGFVYIFAFIAAGFAVAATIVRGLAEPADSVLRTSGRTPQHHFRSAWRVYTQDRSFRRAANVGMLFILGIMLFPHYNWLATEQLGAVDVDMVTWVIAQNIGVGVFSPLAGMIADHCGNRLAMRLEILLAAMVPLLAVLLASGLIEDAGRFYWVVFAFLGLMPVTMKTVFNYTLELAHETDHPRYLSTMRICFAVPFVISPFAGLLLDVFSGASRFVGVCLLFCSVSLLMGIGGLLTFTMEEPRHRPIDTSELPTVRG